LIVKGVMGQGWELNGEKGKKFDHSGRGRSDVVMGNSAVNSTTKTVKEEKMEESCEKENVNNCDKKKGRCPEAVV